MALSVGWLTHWVDRSDTLGLVAGFLVFGAAFLAVPRAKASPTYWLAVAIALRLIAAMGLPHLSDDFYRFVWDGRLWLAGIHPFSAVPDQLIATGAVSGPAWELLHAQLNSPQYYTVYPPVCQAIFWLSTAIFSSTAAAVVCMKLTLCAFEGIALWAMRQYPGASWQWYALNPLVIVEICGNCHFEGAMVCFLVLGLWALQRDKITWAALFWALATASKLLPLLFLPLLVCALPFKSALRFTLVFMAALLLLFLPLADAAVLAHMGSSLQLYFRQFEFNGPVYAVLKYGGDYFWKKNYGREIGPLLGIGVFVLAWAIALLARKKKPQWPVSASFLPFWMAITALMHLFLSSTVHPWYVVPAAALGAMSGFRTPIVWSFAVVLSYSHYNSIPFAEKPVWIAAEYALVLLAIFFEKNTVRHDF